MARIAFIDQTGADAGGAQESFALLLRFLPPDIEPHVVLFQEGNYAARLRALGFDVTVFPISQSIAQATREQSGVTSALDGIRAAVRLSSWLRRSKIELVYTHTVKAHFIAAPAALFAGIPCVMHVRDILEGRSRAALRTVAASCSKRRIAISSAVAKAYALPATSVVFNPVELSAYADLPAREQAYRRIGIEYDPDVPLIGIVGRINRWKGHDRFLRIAQSIAARMPARFLIAGSAIFRDADFLEELQTQCDLLGIRDRVVFVPWTDEVRWIYAALDLHCNCSTREPFGRTVIEAAAAGVPTVCFSDSGVSETIVDGITGRVVPAADEAAFTQAAIELLAERGSPAMRPALREFARRFDPSTHAAQIAHILRKAAV